MNYERLFRGALNSYPRSYRASHRDEMLDVLLEVSEQPGMKGRHVAREVASLVARGLTMRVASTFRARDDLPVLAALGSCLVVVAGVLGVHLLASNVVRAAGLTGYPGALDGAAWLDPRWPVHLTWMMAAALLLTGRSRFAVLMSWGGVFLHSWLILVATTGAAWWLGDVGPTWSSQQPGGPEGGWWTLGVVAAVVASASYGSRLRHLASQTGRVAAVAGAGVAISLTSLLLSIATDTIATVDNVVAASGVGAVSLVLVGLAAGVAWCLFRTARTRAAL